MSHKYLVESFRFYIFMNCKNYMKNQEKIFNIPNLLSLYRLLATPVLAYVAYLGEEQLFFYWFLINMFTDALDGFIARKFNMQTKLGAKLDSLADFACIF